MLIVNPGIILAGWWCTAHEAGHGSLSDYSVVNTTVGYLMHSVSFRRFRRLSRANGLLPSSFWFHTLHGDPRITLITKPPLLLTETRTLCPRRVPHMVFLPSLSRRRSTITSFSKKPRCTLYFACSSCRHWDGNTTSSPTSWVTRSSTRKAPTYVMHSLPRIKLTP